MLHQMERNRAKAQQAGQEIKTGRCVRLCKGSPVTNRSVRAALHVELIMLLAPGADLAGSEKNQ